MKEKQSTKNIAKKATRIKICSNCGKEICNENQSGLCINCYHLKQNKTKILLWKQTGKTGTKVSSHIPNVIREYILDKQNGKCKICNIPPVWNGKQLNFILDHIDGDASNNHENNLRLICPNCDSQLDTYKSKNKNSARNFRKMYYLPKNQS